MAKVFDHKIIEADEDRPRISRKIRKNRPDPDASKSLDCINYFEEDTPADIDEPNVQKVKVWDFDIDITRSYKSEIILPKSYLNFQGYRSGQTTASEEEYNSLPRLSIQSKPSLADCTPCPEDTDGWEEKYPLKRLSVPFTLNNKYSERTVVFKTFHPNRRHVFFGQVSRKNAGFSLFQVKKRYLITVSNEGINLFRNMKHEDLEDASPTRQFLFSCERISATQKGPKKFSLQIGEKKVYNLEADQDVTNWCDFINNRSISQNPETIQKKPWRTSHITKEKFMKQANTFDILRFCDRGVKSFGIILRTHDKNAPKRQYYSYTPEVLFYSQTRQRLSVQPVERVPDHHDAYLVRLAGFKCDEGVISEALEEISDIIKQSKIKKFTSLDFSAFIRQFYINLGICDEISQNCPVKRTHFRDIFNSKSVEFLNNCYFTPKMKIITPS